MKSLATIRVGVIGLGQIALKAHLSGYAQLPGCQITAIHSLREQHAKDIAKQYGVPHIYKDVDRLLESKDVDAVSICTPNFTHAATAIKALKEGKHVLVEKPMAMNRVEALAMIQAGKKAKRILMVHQNMRFDPAIRTAHKLLAKGIIGEIFAVKSSLTHKGPQAWSQKANWFFDRKKSGGGALMDLGPHVFDTLSFLLDDQAVMVGAVAADGRKVKLSKGMAPVQTDVHTACLLKFRKGAIGMVNVGWADNDYHNRFYFYGSKGVMSLNLGKGEPITVEYRNKPGREFPDLDKGSFSPTIYGHFLDCIRHKKTPMVSGEEGLRTIELVEAGYRFMQMVFQDPAESLNARQPVGTILEEPLVIHRLGDSQARSRRVDELLSLVGLSRDSKNRYPFEFSGGQRQRIGIARALALNPKLIICDEPVSALDVSIQSQVLNLLLDLQREFRLSYLFIAHNLAVVRHVSDRIAVMYLGRIVELAGAEELCSNPRHPYTQALIAAVPVPDPLRRRKKAAVIGDIPSPIHPPPGCPFHPRCPIATDFCRTNVPLLRNLAPPGKPPHVASCHYA